LTVVIRTEEAASRKAKADGDAIPGQVGGDPGVRAVDTCRGLIAERAMRLVFGGDHHRDHVVIGTEIVQPYATGSGKEGVWHSGILD
jgi:hypothetical protein